MTQLGVVSPLANRRELAKGYIIKKKPVKVLDKFQFDLINITHPDF